MLNLKKHQITLGELWDNPRSRGVFQRRIPALAKHPLKASARPVTLGQLAALLSASVPQAMFDGFIRELQQL